MKNQKIILIFVAIIILLVSVAPIIKATQINPLNIINEEEVNNETNNLNNSNNSTNNEANSQTTNNEESTIKNNENENKNENTDISENKLPQTGVTEDTTLFVFIAICLVSAIYAYTKIRKYKNI